MTFWFLIREQNALWMKPPMFSREPPALCAFMVWPHTFNNFCFGSTASWLSQHKSSHMDQCWVWCCEPGTIAPHHRYHKSIITFHFYWSSTTYACRRCDKGPAQRHKVGLLLNLMLPGLQCFKTFTGHILLAIFLSFPFFARLILTSKTFESCSC